MNSKQKISVGLVLAAACLALACGSSQPKASNVEGNRPYLTISNLQIRGGQAIAQYPGIVRFSVAGAAVKAPIEQYAIFREAPVVGPSPDISLEKTDETGGWHSDMPLAGISEGSWDRWVVINGRESNHVRYTVIPSRMAQN